MASEDYVPITNTHWRRYLTTNADTTSFALTVGYKALPADTADYKFVYNTDHRDETGNGPGTTRWRGLELIFFGSATQNLTADYKLWVWQSQDGSVIPGSYGLFIPFGSGTITLGNTAGPAATGVITTSDLIADTLTWTLSTSSTTIRGLGDTIETAYSSGGATAYSPANDEVAVLIIPDLGGVDAWLLEFDRTGANTANAAYRWTR